MEIMRPERKAASGYKHHVVTEATLLKSARCFIVVQRYGKAFIHIEMSLIYKSQTEQCSVIQKKQQHNEVHYL